jgi:hypothetical protein
MFEVSADVGEGVVHTQKTAKKFTRSKRTTTVSRKKTAQRRAHMDADSRSTSRASLPPLAPPPPSRTTNREVFAAVAIGVVFVAGITMALVGFPSSRVASDTRSTSVAESGQSHAVQQSVEVPTPIHVATPVREATVPALAPRAIVEKPKPTPSATIKGSTPEYVPSPAPAAPMVGPQAPDAAPASAAVQSVTISGCLEVSVDGDQYRLTNTEGADAPKARSWKSGFLKKGSAPVDLVDFSEGPMLRKYVGHRVVATGLLSGRQLRLRSMQSGGSTCQ